MNKISDKNIRLRYNILNVVIYIVGIVLLLQLFNLQIVHGSEYRETSNTRLTREAVLKAARGDITDSSGVKLVTTKTGFSLELYKTKIDDKELNNMILKMAEILEENKDEVIDNLPIDINPYKFTMESEEEQKEWKQEYDLDENANAEECFNALKEKYKIQSENIEDIRKIMVVRYEIDRNGYSNIRPIIVAKDISRESSIQIEEQGHLLPGTAIVTEPIVTYPYGTLASHILGYLGLISAEEYAEKSDEYDINDVIGRDGIQYMFEKYLKGQDGIRQIDMSVDGEVTGEYISKEDFIKRYSSIYSSIGVNDINISIGEINSKTEIPISITMNTLAGKLKFEDIKVNIVEEDKDYKIVWNESLIIPNMIKDDKIGVEVDKAIRGQILDRDNNKLAYDGKAYQVSIHPSVFTVNKDENLSKFANILDVSIDKISEKIENQNPEHKIPILKVSQYEDEKINSLKTIEGVIIDEVDSRVYQNSEALGCLIGYTDNITKEELEKYKDKDYNSQSKIGKSGLEQVYEDKLRARDGVHIFIKRGEEKITLAKTEPINGENIKLSIDSKLQENIYAQMNNEKGASVALHPQTGEVLAMVSSPSYNSNTKVTYITKTISNKWKESEYAHNENRFNNAYSPGSTMKLITASIGLDENVLNSNDTFDIKGLNWQKSSDWGEYYVTRVKDPKKPVNLYDATKYSDNIYFADLAIKIGKDKLIEGAKKFGIGETLDFEYPMDKSQISNKGKLDNEMLLADSGYGQGEVLMTPLDVAMSYSALSNNGNIMKPRLVISENKEQKVYSEAINKENLENLISCFGAVINDEDGTGNLGKINGVNLVGKTGTAEIKKSKDDTEGSENGWFVAVNMDEPKIAISMIIEDLNGKSTASHVVPKVKNIIESYINN